jgi:hypothetical protein
MSTRFFAGVVGAALLASAPLGAQVANGGFEAPVVPVGSFMLFNAGSSFAGWSVTGARGNIGITSTTFNQFGFSFPAHSGAQWLDLTGLSSNQPIGVQQTVTTVPGTLYDLSFWVGNISNPGGAFGTSSTVNVFVNGVALAPATNSGGVGTTTLDWQQFARSFTATGTSTTIALINGDPATDNSNGLDDVLLTVGTQPPPTTTPEPGAALLLATGLVPLGVVLRSRRRRVRRTTAR